MLQGLIAFLLGALGLCIVIYIVHLILGMLKLPEPIRQIALLIFALVCLVALVALVLRAAPAGGGGAGLGITL